MTLCNMTSHSVDWQCFISMESAEYVGPTFNHLMQIECVGTVDSGIADMSWSPDQEVMVLATGKCFTLTFKATEI